MLKHNHRAQSLKEESISKLYWRNYIEYIAVRMVYIYIYITALISPDVHVKNINKYSALDWKSNSINDWAYSDTRFQMLKMHEKIKP